MSKVIKPFGHGDPLMEGVFFDFVMFAWSADDFVKAFERDSGYRLPRSPLETLIDQATGHGDAMAVAFIEWLIRNHWGEAETEPA